MVLIETDILVSLILSIEKHHREAVEIIKKIRSLALSPYALIELDLLILLERIVVRDLEQFYRELNELMKFYGIKIVEPSPTHLMVAHSLRTRYDLTYFDSLHVATAIVQRDVLVSYDKNYSRVKELRCIHQSY